MEGRVVVNIPLDGFKNFGKHPVGINVKPDFKRYLTKFFFIYAFDDNLPSSKQLRNKKAT